MSTSRSHRGIYKHKNINVCSHVVLLFLICIFTVYIYLDIVLCIDTFFIVGSITYITNPFVKHVNWPACQDEQSVEAQASWIQRFALPCAVWVVGSSHQRNSKGIQNISAYIIDL